jgi:hypothetical protein
MDKYEYEAMGKCQSWVKTKKYQERNLPHCYPVQYISETVCLDIQQKHTICQCTTLM